MVQPRRVSAAVSTEVRGGDGVFVALPGAAALHVAEETLPGVADAAGDRRQRFDAGLVGDERCDQVDVRALGVGPGIIALDADHDAAGELVVAARLHPAEPAVGIVAAERLTEGWIGLPGNERVLRSLQSLRAHRPPTWPPTEQPVQLNWTGGGAL